MGKIKPVTGKLKNKNGCWSTFHWKWSRSFQEVTTAQMTQFCSIHAMAYSKPVCARLQNDESENQQSTAETDLLGRNLTPSACLLFLTAARVKKPYKESLCGHLHSPRTVWTCCLCAKVTAADISDFTCTVSVDAHVSIQIIYKYKRKLCATSPFAPRYYWGCQSSIKTQHISLNQVLVK